jgi:hypothetical protein
MFAIVTKASQDLYRYERICEEHSAILRRDPDGCLKAHREYTANSNSMGFMPARDEFDRYIEESEEVLKKECRTLLDHLHVVHAAYFLCRLLMRKMSEHGEHVDLEFIHRKVELECVLVFLSSLHAYQRLLQQKTSLCFPQVSCCGYSRLI